MCMGIPMQVLVSQPGWAEVSGRGETRTVNTRLVGDTAPGQWLLIFLNDAREQITAQRAMEVNATLDLLQAAMLDPDESAFGAHAAASFDLPSAMSLEALRELTHAGTPQPAANPAARLACKPVSSPGNIALPG